MAVLVQTHHLTKTYKDVLANDGIDLKISKGEFVAILGQNGAGKTTLFRILSRVIDPDKPGQLEFHESFDRFGDIAYIPSEAGHFARMRVDESLAFFCQLAQLDRKSSQEAIERVVEEFGFRNTLKKRVQGLSKGWQQRLHLAHALLKKPKILIADEPFNGLDLVSRQNFTRSLEKLSEDGVAVLVSSHTPEHLSGAVKRLCVVHQGKILADEAADSTHISDRYFELMDKAESSS